MRKLLGRRVVADLLHCFDRFRKDLSGGLYSHRAEVCVVDMFVEAVTGVGGGRVVIERAW